MFERYTERARRAIFFARYEATRFGSDSVETHHLLLAVLREDRDLARRLLKSDETLDAVRKQLDARFPPGKSVPTPVDLPLSEQSKRALGYAAEEAEQLKHGRIGTRHLLLGLLREESSTAAEVLREQGLSLSKVREEIAHWPEEEPPAFTREGLHRLVDELPEQRWDAAGRMLQALCRETAPFDSSAAGHLVSGESAFPRSLEAGFTEKVRRALFFARYEASQFGSATIESEHLLLGLLREDKSLAMRFLGSHAVLEQIRTEVKERTPVREKVPTSIDIPLSEESQRVMAFSAEESERLNHKHIGTEHLLMGLLREEKCVAAELLNKHGVELSKVREQMHRLPD